MWIVIDTNAFYSDLRLKKSLDLLFRKIEDINFSLRIPEVVVQETVNIYKEQRQSHLSRLSSSTRELKSFTSLEFTINIRDENLKQDLSEYEHYLREKISTNGEIIQYPTTSLQALMERALSRRKPFNKNGVGFRDVLIWETILELMTHDDYVGIVFITNNYKDFFKNEKGGLHPNLIEDLENKNFDLNSIKTFNSVQDFIKDMVEPALEENIEIQDSIRNGTYPGIDLYTMAEGYIWDLIVGYPINPECLPNFAEENVDVTISSGVSDYEVVLEDLNVKRLARTELLITVSYYLDCEIDLFVPKRDAYGYGFDELGFYITERDWNEYVVQAGITLPFKITLRYIYNEEGREVVSADIIGAKCSKELNSDLIKLLRDRQLKLKQ